MLRKFLYSTEQKALIMTTHPRRNVWNWLLSLFAIGFGLLTLQEGGSVLFFDGEARQAAGHYVPFVLWFNFLAGFIYIVAGIGFLIGQRWACWIAITIAVATAFVFLAFAVHIFLGGAWEQRTAIAMTVRTFVWTAIAVLAWRRATMGGTARV